MSVKLPSKLLRVTTTYLVHPKIFSEACTSSERTRRWTTLVASAPSLQGRPKALP